MFILDTNVLSELMRDEPDARVLEWVAAQRVDLVFTTAVSQAEVLSGLARFLGNKAAHETSPADERVLDASMQIAEHMLTSVYLLPKIAKAIQK